MKQTLQLNIIPFSAPVKLKEFAFYSKQIDDTFCPINKNDFKDAEKLNGHFDDDEWIYSDFQKPKTNAVSLKVDLTEHTRFAQHYYRHLIREYFKGVADIVRSNFTNEVEVWFHDAAV